MPKLTEPKALKHAQQESTIVDVRSPEEYAAGHVENAVNIPLDELETRQGEIPQGTPVVTYCTMYHPGHSRGERAAALLEKLGFEASALNGGYPAWLELHEEESE